MLGGRGVGVDDLLVADLVGVLVVLEVIVSHVRRRVIDAADLALPCGNVIACGFRGSRDPLANPLPLAIWTGLWVGLSLACLFLGNLWRPLNPWTGPAATLRRRLGRTGRIGLARLGAWPAALGLLAFAWFEIVSRAPADPAVLARTALAYWLVILAAAVLEGEDWLERGEAFTVSISVSSPASRRSGASTPAAACV